jgi:tryptophanyl-tRNA synthetase
MVVVSGIKPTGSLTLGNYIGGIKQFVKFQNDNPDSTILIFIADLHALTVKSDKAELKKHIKEVAGLYIACGLDPKKTIMFLQSDVLEHANLGWIMESTSYLGELERMTQYKDKKQKQVEGIRSSLLTYPALMAADILIYNPDIVPIGDDQKQHLELTRNLAERFNSTYGDTFKLPEPFITKTGARIKSLQDPSVKMDKTSPNEKSFILLLDDLNRAKNKILSAVTDSFTTIKYDEVNQPGITNLINIYSSLTSLSIKEIEEKYKDSNYSVFKSELATIVVDTLTTIQKKYYEIINSGELESILSDGAKRASVLASRTLTKVKKRMGLGL